MRVEVAGSVIDLTATLAYESEHFYFYFEDGVPYDEGELRDAGEKLDNQVWPILTSEFGTDPGPGFDNDPRIAILHANVPGVGGYFTDQDLLPPVVAPASNQREMIVLNSSGIDLTSDNYLGLVAHEMQHLLHNFADSSEDSWINEGLSEVANYRLSGSLSLIPTYLNDPDVQLNSWGSVGGSAANYGMSNLFLQYVLSRTGGIANAHTLAEQPGDAFEGLRQYFAAVGFDGTIEDLFRDWVVANYLDEGEGIYSYPDYDVQASVLASHDQPATEDATVSQFGADYVRFDGGPDRLTIRFDGDDTVAHIPTEPPASPGYWWANRGDSIDPKLTREVDLTGVTSATLTYKTWFDMERGWDFAYVEASRDGGTTWEVLPASSSTTADPLDVAYGPGYTGTSGGGDEPEWLDESVDLSAFTGGPALIRFEYVTDEAVNLAGWAIDDIAIDAVGWSDDAASAGDWVSEGWIHADAPLAQRFVVQVIIEGEGGPRVEQVALDDANKGDFVIDDYSGIDDVIVVVSGMTDGTSLPAHYVLSFE